MATLNLWDSDILVIEGGNPFHSLQPTNAKDLILKRLTFGIVKEPFFYRTLFCDHVFP